MNIQVKSGDITPPKSVPSKNAKRFNRLVTKVIERRQAALRVLSK